MSKREEQKKTQQARVLGGFVLNGVEYNSNDIIEAGTEIIVSLGSSVDASNDAVEFCLSLENPVIKKHN